MKTPKFLAAGLIAAGLVIGGSAVAHATPSPYVTVAWSYAGYPDLSQPQPFIAAVPGTDLHVFDGLAASPEWCGKPIQVDVYRTVDERGVPWEWLKESGSLQTSHDGGFLAYDAVPTPYRVITPEEYPCAPVSTPEPTPTETPSSGSPTPSASSSPTPSASSSPTAPATGTPSATPSPTVTPTSSPSPSASAAPTPTPSSSTSASPTATGTPSAPASVVNSTPSSSSSPATTTAPRAARASSTELAYTGTNPWPGIGAASVLFVAGIALLVAKRVRRG